MSPKFRDSTWRNSKTLWEELETRKCLIPYERRFKMSTERSDVAEPSKFHVEKLEILLERNDATKNWPPFMKEFHICFEGTAPEVEREFEIPLGE